MKLLIKNGTLITSLGRREADVAISGGKIEAVYGRTPGGIPDGSFDDADVIDASGLYVLPGAIDAHTHFELPFPSAVSADDFYTGTRAAACGGVTTVIDFVTPSAGGSLLDALQKRREAADPKVCIDYALHMSLTDAREDTLREMRDAADTGVTGFKVFLTYDFRLSADDFEKVLHRAKELDALIMVHAEAHDELEMLKAEFIRQGKTDPWHHYLSRPESVETKGIEQALHIAAKTGASLYIVHVASGEGLEAIKKARQAGCRVYAETCPQYLHFTSEVYQQPDGHNFVCSPPIKGQASRSMLLEGINSRAVSIVATDHCPFTLKEKALGKDDFTKIPNGVMGVENLYPYILSLANSGQIAFERAVELCCEKPAEIFALNSRKGSITPGKDADIVLYDPDRDFTVSQDMMHSAGDYTIWEGVKFKGYIVETYSRGNLVYQDGEFFGKRGSGRFLAVDN